MDYETAVEVVKNRLEFSEGKMYYLVIETTNVKEFTKTGRDYLSSSEGGVKGVIAAAFLSRSNFSSVLINLYLRLSTPNIPSKFFSNKQDALEWIDTIRENN